MVKDNYITAYNNGTRISVNIESVNVKSINGNIINKKGGSLKLISTTLSFFAGLLPYFAYKYFDNILFFFLTKFKISAKFIKLLISAKLENSIPKKLLLSTFQNEKNKRLTNTELNIILENNYIRCYRRGICHLYNPDRMYIDTYKLYFENGNYIFQFTNSLNKIFQIEYNWDSRDKQFYSVINNLGLIKKQYDNKFLLEIDNLEVHLLIDGSDDAIYLKYYDIEYIFVDSYIDRFLYNGKNLLHENYLPIILDKLLKDYIPNRSTMHNNSSNEYTLPQQKYSLGGINECFKYMELNKLKKYTINDIKKQYFILAKKYHPNKGGNKQDFVKLKECFDKIKNYI